MPKIWEEDPQAAETYRKKERVKKRKQQHVNKVVRQAGIRKLNTPIKRKIKILKQQMKRQIQKELANTMNSSTGGPCSYSTPSEPGRLYITKAIWRHLSTKLKHKVTCALKISLNVPKGFNLAVRKVLGLNVSNMLEVAEKVKPLSAQYCLGAIRMLHQQFEAET